MRQFSMLAAIGVFTIASLTARAQFVVDGRATAAEIGTGMGKYQLAATYTGNHLEADRGLSALYVGYTATTLNIMLVGSAESATTTPSGGYRSLMLYLNTPARPGAPAGTALPGGSDPQSPLKHRPIMDNPTDYGFRVSVGPTSTTANDVYFSRVSYVTGTTVTPGTDTFIAAGTKAGGQVVAPTTLDLAGSKFAYNNTATLTANTTNSGFELEIPLAALGTATVPITTGTNLEMVAAYTDGDGVFFSDVIPQIAGRTTTLGSNPDFSAIPGNQFLTVQLGTGVLASRSTVASGFNFQVYPNPASATSTIAYTVPAGRQPVSLAVYNALGQRVRALASAEQAGPQQLALGALPAGAYLVKLQIGDQLTSQKVVVQ
ncbi:T9SS type A sorting domain-containing protein [Microvirga sp. STS02]|uniref:T9SS type A sorting domain-containing protein n=1 Tax=Hymenobacter negativus TaxID=2795026 RepID=UPI0018DE0EB3|nr:MULTISPECIES: T9SS type A sorting domain-containing protein [Bacteria]MBH8567574.1 T9SS type A sorting domain-containing protein [Hymenobacter negativus]MBR7207306.1 T9SS type A sorting domain-containing protein [Microvirga sp. STS02]